MNFTRGKPFWLSLSLIIIDGLFFGLTNPSSSASLLLIVGFVLVLVTLYWLFYNVQRIAGLYLAWLSGQKYLCLAVSLVCGLLLALQSVGQLTPRDALLVSFAALILYAYLSYNRTANLART